MLKETMGACDMALSIADFAHFSFHVKIRNSN